MDMHAREHFDPIYRAGEPWTWAAQTAAHMRLNATIPHQGLCNITCSVSQEGTVYLLRAGYSDKCGCFALDHSLSPWLIEYLGFGDLTLAKSS